MHARVDRNSRSRIEQSYISRCGIALAIALTMEAQPAFETAVYDCQTRHNAALASDAELAKITEAPAEGPRCRCGQEPAQPGTGPRPGPGPGRRPSPRLRCPPHAGSTPLPRRRHVPCGPLAMAIRMETLRGLRRPVYNAALSARGVGGPLFQWPGSDCTFVLAI